MAGDAPYLCDWFFKLRAIHHLYFYFLLQITDYSVKARVCLSMGNPSKSYNTERHRPYGTTQCSCQPTQSHN